MFVLVRNAFHSNDDHRLGGRGGDGIVTVALDGGFLLTYGFVGRDVDTRVAFDGEG